MKVLSLFDGMACGMIAMQLAGVQVESYDAYEIDKYAIKTAQHNFPMIKEHGDVFSADFTRYEGVDFLIGGSPCTYWSIAQTKNRETVASGMGWELFSQYVRALHEAKPKYFIYENNKSMSKQIRVSIDKAFGFEAVLINSALVSAQNRQRLYWVGKRNADGTYSKVNVEQPADRGILLRDILENGVVWQEKSYNLTTRCCGSIPEDTLKRHRHTMAAEPINVTADGKSQTLKAQYTKNNVDNFCCYTSTYGASGVAEPVCVAERGRMYCGQPQHYEARTDGKTNTLTSVEKDNRVAEPVACRCRGRVDASGNGYAKYECREDGKSNTLDTNTTNGAMVAEPVKVGYVGNGGQGNRAYSVNGKAVAQTAQSGGMGSNTGLYAEPINVTEDGMSQTLKASPSSAVSSMFRNGTFGITGVAEPITDICQVGAMPRPDGEISTSAGFRIYSTEAKGRYLCANGGRSGTKTGLYAIPYAIEFDDDGRPIKAVNADGKEITIYEVRDGKITIKGKQYHIKLKDGYYIIRKLTVRECMRLQTVPEWYEFPVSDSQAYKMLGNGWTCEVIAHILKYLKEA